MHKALRHPPGLVGPEHTKIDGFLPSGKLFDKLEAIGNHMYGSGDFESPDSLLPSIQTAGRWAKGNHKELWCTEYGKLKDHEKWDPLKLGQIVLNTLVHGGVSVYSHWDLFWYAESALTVCNTSHVRELLCSGSRNVEISDNRDTLRLYFLHFLYFSRNLLGAPARGRGACCWWKTRGIATNGRRRMASG